MSDPTAETSSKLTAADVAKRVKRTIVVKDGDAMVARQVPLKADEIIAFREYDDRIVAVTSDGQKFSSTDRV